MQGILGGGLLVVAFGAVAAFGLVVMLRLFRISRPDQATEGARAWPRVRTRA